MSTYNEQMQEIVTQYRRTGEDWPASARMIAKWAIHNGYWKPQPSAILNHCAEDLAKAMREEYITDAQGRRVRAKHAAILQEDGQQTVLWEDIRTAPREHMENAFQHRRRGILADCRQLKMDVDSYNQNNNSGQQIQTIFDFTRDLEEVELAREQAWAV